VLKIKVSELEFEVIPIIQNFLSLTHDHLESLSASPCSSDDFFLKLNPFCDDKKGEKEKVWQIIKRND